jgi:hypothetical protein
MLKSVSLRALFRTDYDDNNNIRFAGWVYPLSPDDTYITVVGTSNFKEQVDILLNNVNVLYKGPMSINKWPGHSYDKSPRQYIVIFEAKCQEPTVQDVQSVKKMGKIQGVTI